MRFQRLISILVIVTGGATLARAGWWEWFTHGDVQVIVNTDVTSEGAGLPAASSEHPVYYVGVSLGYRDLGGIIAGDKLPAKETMYRWIAKALAKQGYLPADATHPPTEIIAFAWGSLYVRPVPGYPGYPGSSSQINRFQMLRFLGGEKLGLVSQFPAFPDIELVPQLYYLKPSAQRLRTAASEDLYMAVLIGYDLKAAEHRQRRILWRTRIACPARGLVMADTLPTMVSIAAPMIARATEAPVWIRATDRYKPAITIGNPKVEEYLGSGPLPFVDDSGVRLRHSPR